jgi:hypothetical protein
LTHDVESADGLEKCMQLAELEERLGFRSTFDTDPFEPQPDGMGTIFPFWVPNQDPQKEMAKRSQGASMSAYRISRPIEPFTRHPSLFTIF